VARGTRSAGSGQLLAITSYHIPTMFADGFQLLVRPADEYARPTARVEPGTCMIQYPLESLYARPPLSAFPPFAASLNTDETAYILYSCYLFDFTIVLSMPSAPISSSKRGSVVKAAQHMTMRAVARQFHVSEGSVCYALE
jgi:hypothetical protein